MTDLNILWPACKDAALNIDYARAAFAKHAFRDNAWVEHYGVGPLAEFIENLE